MTMSQERVNDILRPIVERVIPLYNNNEFRKEEEDFWVGRAALDFCKDDNYDRGIFSIYFFNLVHLKRGEGIFQPQGLPHAYLEGQNVEVMANSDNVLRAGLTQKHIDVAELMKHVEFQATIPNILRPASGSHKTFFSPAEEFELHQYHLQNSEEAVETKTAETWFLTSGSAKIKNEEKEWLVKKGEGLFVAAGTRLSVISSGETEFFRVVVPLS
jgi:mannose-6-phosphate isomerase